MKKARDLRDKLQLKLSEGLNLYLTTLIINIIFYFIYLYLS